MPRPDLSPIAAHLPETVPFVGPEAIARRSGIPLRARIGANESPFGPAPSVVDAMARAARDSWHYGDPENHDLRQAIADHLGIPFANVMPGEGVDAILGMAVRLYAAPGSKVVTSLGGYPTFNYHLAGYGTLMHTMPYIGDREDIDGLARAATETRAAMVYLANPDNPMGSWWDAAAVERFIAAVPETTMIVLDEAYGEFAPQGTLPPIDITRSNILRMRTFSKAYGMAGARVGYVIGEAQSISAFNRIRNHFGISNVAQAGAIAALADQAHLRWSIDEVRKSLEDTAAIARRHGLLPLPTATNFIALDCGHDGAHARAIVDGLAQRGVFIRMPGVAGLNRCIRVSAGTADDRALLDQALGEVLAGLNA
ncbi:MAG: pyridoxal phosphate-dependent aminotransferase [Candidatus Devosia phytovorans]|uniref:Pyridoxal phosphate-dependent aminotransferase n=1 Tax=Candidatus Devosia phytovorans TaxID=3121372 RepID=A0AAJ5VWI8_9HYPH|nr:pyridoxal phosphate-dependent aminotransferase [Devosia sp.]WEK05500.1 MAG: pyridoxal phosphate-dependent aminotransferase [Devosia sp.]